MSKKRIVIIIVMFIAAFAFIVFVWLKDDAPPEQSEEATVTEKRISRTNGSSALYYTFYVGFEFPDGSVKEFKVGRNTIRTNKRSEPNCFAYNSLNEGDTGILTYQELNNAEKHIFPSSDFRNFISFEKDGGLKVESRITITKPYVFKLKILIIIFAVVLTLGFALLLMGVFKPLFMIKRVEQAEFIDKKIKDRAKNFNGYIASFKLSDGSVKEFYIIYTAGDCPNGLSMSVRNGDKGVLSYKETKNIDKKYKEEDRYRKDRIFIGFEKEGSDSKMENRD